jgi:hypothetical protein
MHHGVSLQLPPLIESFGGISWTTSPQARIAADLGRTSSSDFSDVDCSDMVVKRQAAVERLATFSELYVQGKRLPTADVGRRFSRVIAGLILERSPVDSLVGGMFAKGCLLVVDHGSLWVCNQRA